MSNRRVSDEVGGQLTGRMKIEPRCKVCSLGYELLSMVNRQLINGATYTDVHQTLWSLKDSGVVPDPPSYQSIRTHTQKHLDFKDAAIRRNIERRAAEFSMDIDNGIENLLTDVAVAETMMRKGYADLVEGRMKIDAKDLLASAKLVREFTKDSQGSLDVAELYAQLGWIMQAVQEVMPPDKLPELFNRIEELRQRSGLMTAEVIDEDPLELE